MNGTVVRSLSIETSAADAFDAFTRVAELLSWWCEGALVGRRAGGNWALGFTDERGGTQATMMGKIETYEPGHRLAVRNIAYEPRSGEPLEGLTIDLSFAERDGACLITVEERIPDAGPAYEVYRREAGSGWEERLADLKRYLEGPRQRRVLVEAGLPEN
ncbi:MAG: SRPBCC domain-containing protein [Acidobacteriota bacterium]|nr:SRPBCC domain-containing protein [Acidobacteriota bacterium]